MACACNKGSSSARQARRQDEQPATAGAYEFEVTYNNGGTQYFSTEQEAMAALAMQGGGFRMVPRR